MAGKKKRMHGQLTCTEKVDCGIVYMQFENRVLGFSVLLTLLASSIHVCFLSSSSTPIPITVSLQTNTYTNYNITVFREEVIQALAGFHAGPLS